MLLANAADEQGELVSFADTRHIFKARVDIAAADGEGKKLLALSVQQSDKSVAAYGDRLLKALIPHVDIAEAEVGTAGVFNVKKPVSGRLQIKCDRFK